MRAATRLLVVDDHPLLCEGVQTVVDREPDIAVVGTAPDTDAAIDALRASSPRVVLMDVSAPESSAVEATRRVLAEDPDLSTPAYAALAGAVARLIAGPGEVN